MHDTQRCLLHAGDPVSGKLQRSTVERAFANIAAAERPLQEALLQYLVSRDDVQVSPVAHVHIMSTTRALCGSAWVHCRNAWFGACCSEVTRGSCWSALLALICPQAGLLAGVRAFRRQPCKARAYHLLCQQEAAISGAGQQATRARHRLQTWALLCAQVPPLPLKLLSADALAFACCKPCCASAALQVSVTDACASLQRALEAAAPITRALFVGWSRGWWRAVLTSGRAGAWMMLS